ncbi:DUF6298 domain-containing protein [Sphingobacterium bovistauri]|uniref:Pectate lyase n=1 Tax=Sphingobacterium bovistauri TaxID=2781959 RepID=A0ABS7Z6X5_9SPHI|nr:DUF6298 domain-containing protein [Sphingobacterium bovistauri]MCA5004704.1 pectate lyase [Sphingobacterium bovistauri]
MLRKQIISVAKNMFLKSFTLKIGVYILCCINYANGQQNKPLQIKEDKISIIPDSLGNRIPDFSFAGFKAGESEIPFIATKVSVPIIMDDATQLIQYAIDYVSKLPLDKSGFRGAVQLSKGTYKVFGTLNLHTSGVVLRGAGIDAKGTIIVGAGKSRNTLIKIIGNDNKIFDNKVNIENYYVPVGTNKIRVTQGAKIKVGDQIVITRPSSMKWINALGTHHFGGGITAIGWKVGQRDIVWDRRVVAINGNELEVDAPLTNALEKTFAESHVQKYEWTGRVENIGVENLKVISEYDTTNQKDEDHRWMAISVENARDIWVRRIEFKHFAGSAVYLLSSSSRVTVEDCISRSPISEIGGQRRYTFHTKGQQTLFQRCYSEGGYHDFSTGFMAAGPNAFVQCHAYDSHNFSGAIDSWATGVLFDNVLIDNQAISLKNRGQDGNGAGWTAANSMIWQSSAALVECYQPSTAMNWAFGVWAQFQGNGYWDMSNEHIKPRSLYYAQLQSRIGDVANSRTKFKPIDSGGTSSPSIEQAKALTAAAYATGSNLDDFIYQEININPLNVSFDGLWIDEKQVDKSVSTTSPLSLMSIKNGWLIASNKVMTGGKIDVQWWSGSSRPYGAVKAKPHITRFVPGEMGLGLTDDLSKMANEMVKNNVLSIDHNYGLWYDRRRDDHERTRRINNEVWPPFYELPFARSGQGVAYDGLSKYDLTRYNHFYWNRLQEFANLADQQGLLLMHQQYFQHNILEAGAHYTDFPWRTANNINNVGFPEPVHYAGDKRIFMDEQFYDINNPVRRELHRAYIRKCLDNFKDNSNVIQLISAEYTGPLHFVEFWIDVIKEWKKETSRQVIVALSTTKDVQDAILNDKSRSQEIQIIDIRYWHYQADGTAYSPTGGQHLAPRQHARLLKPKKTAFDQVYRAVLEYRNAHPDKVVVYHGDNYPSNAWAVFMAGGSMANLPKINNEDFFKAAATMLPKQVDNVKMLESKEGAILFGATINQIKDILPSYKGTFEITTIDSNSGELSTIGKINLGKKGKLFPDSNQSRVIWLKKR